MGNLSILDGGGAPQQLASSPDGDVANAMIMIRTSEHRKPTYSYAGNFTPVAAPTDVIMIKGSATKTARIKKITLGGLATTAGSMAVSLIRRSTQFTTQGTAVFNALTPGEYDPPNDPAASCVVATIGTANLTSVGAPNGNYGQRRLWLPLVTQQPFPLIWEFATRQDKPIILRGITDFLFINFNGGPLPAAGTVDYEIQIEEDAS
jgi:hypothetical protein